jgi:iron complex transport system substrate-binding protein
MNARTPRIVSLLPAATEIICGAGLRDCLVGVSHECNWPPGLEGLPRVTQSRLDSTAASSAIDAEVKSLAASGAALYEVDAELVTSLRPTLIVTQSQCDVCAVSFAAVAGMIDDSPALADAKLIALSPRSLSEVLADVVRIGAAVGRTVQARAFVAALQERIDAVRRAVEDRREPPRRVVVIEWTDPLMIAGNWTPELAALAGGEYGLGVAGEHSRYVEWNELEMFAPEVVVVAPCGFNLDRSQHEARRLAEHPAWGRLPAVQGDRVHVVDGDVFFNRPGPRLVDSLEILFRALNSGEWPLNNERGLSSQQSHRRLP